MSNSGCHFYEAPAGSGLANLAQRYASEVLAPIAEQLKALDKSTLQFSHKQGEWRIKTIKGHKEKPDSSLTEVFEGNHHRISFPDFGTFVGQQAGFVFELGTASCFPSENGAFFLACETPLPKRLSDLYAQGIAQIRHFGERGVRMAGEHYVPLILQGIKFHKEQKPEALEREGSSAPIPCAAVA
jgi:hypothetical protein